MKYDLVVIGGGPGGLAAAIEAKKNGIDNILVIERDKELGGILQQCIHNGFGLHEFKEELTGPEYAQRFIEKLLEMNIEYKLDTMVLDLTEDKKIHAINSKDGYMVIEAKAVILAMGCRERTRGAISIPGDRPSGVFTAGAAQRFINMEGYMVGKKVLILGSGDIGLIMARRLTLEGAEVKAVVELMPFSGGLTRNIVQCLDDYNIPLYLSHTVIDVVGKDRLEKVVIAKVDENRKPIPGTEKEYECDTLLLSVGLIPENDISRKTGLEIDRRTNGLIVNEMMETSAEGIFACGNVVHVHDLVDFVSAEARKAGAAAARYIKNEVKDGEYKEIINGKGITYTVPQKFRGENIDKALEIFMRVNNIYKNVKLEVKDEEKVLMSLNKQHLAPGEMEKVMVPKKILDTMVGKSLTVEVTGGDK
ncbi:FAD-dependent oxidoreductase [Fusobacterium sp.]|jgi:NADPH-dependent 2,4-dienoyl-CoA reductase/sulfur reductase-like enzyme|uniref:NAD(P)/FAD-dependent oxidoreductase n=1 Tax=Fusobacterium sp. TaxID=68766 RepID=UPI001E1A92E9|nr:FAD-dependent oxidoreductase [Fusobacterium sp.]MBS5790173.1 FAD-dependent oxidoreductase [Fusobacterium sp.]